jgi:hypothetical protein
MVGTAARDYIDERTNPGRGEATRILQMPALQGEIATTEDLRRFELSLDSRNREKDYQITEGTQ